MNAATAHPPRFTSISRSRVQTLLVLTAMVVFGGMQQAAAQTPALNQRQDDAIFSNFTFRDGETLPQLRLHYTTLGNPHKNAAGIVDNTILLLHWTNASGQALLTPEYREALF